jgi:hypothetical protein
VNALLLALCSLSPAVGPSPPPAVDYSRVERKLTREPAYRSKSPRYALLLFGPRAAVRVWVVLDGEEVYVDRNADGDLTGKDRRFANVAACKDITIADPDGKTSYVVTGISSFKQPNSSEINLMVSVDIRGPLSYRQYCDVRTAASPTKAALAHFHGPLTAGPRTINWKVPAGLTLSTAEKPDELYAVVGTMSAEHGCWVVVRTHKASDCAFAAGVRPVVDIEFPAKSPGGKAVKRRYKLDGFC